MEEDGLEKKKKREEREEREVLMKPFVFVPVVVPFRDTQKTKEQL